MTYLNINFIEGSQVFDSATGNFSHVAKFVKDRLTKQLNYRATEESLWATVSHEGTECSRYKLEDGEIFRKKYNQD